MNLVYATDYSDNSVAGLKMANMLAEALKGSLTVVHVFDLNLVLVSTVSITSAKMKKKALLEHHNRIESFCYEHLGKIPDGKSLRASVTENGITSDGILELAEEHQADLILVGMKGGSALKEIIIGSTSRNLIHKANCPVLVIPSGYSEQLWKNIVYASALEETDIYAIKWLVKNLAEPLNAVVQIIHISTPKEYAGEDQMAWFRELLTAQLTYDKMNFNLKFSKDILGTLKSYIDEVDAAVLVMLEREGSGFIRSLVHNDLVKQMIPNPMIPILSLNKARIKEQYGADKETENIDT